MERDLHPPMSMDPTKGRARRARRAQSGVAALEFALVLPLLLMLILGIISIGHGLVVRYVLSSAAYDAARTCTMARSPNPSQCTQAMVQRRLNGAGGQNWCNSLNVQARVGPVAGFPAVSRMLVTVNCGYRGIIGQGYLASHGLAIFNVKAQAAMPF